MEGIVVVNFDASKGEYEITFPKEGFYDMKSLKMKMTETNNHKTWDLVLMRENVEFYTMKMDMKDTKFENGKLKSFIWNTPYHVPFYRYMTTRRSLFNRYFNPMPMLLTPFEVKVDVAGITKIT